MLELRGGGPALLDDPVVLDVRGAPAGTRLTFRTRVRDDDGRVWRGVGEALDALRWAPAKPGVERAALGSLRAVALEVRVEDTSGRAATRELTRTVLADDVKVRRWGRARAFLPPSPVGAVGVPADADPVACALLASRGVLVVAGEAPADLLAAVPGPAPVPLAHVPVPAGVPTLEPEDAAWHALLDRLGARR